MKILAIESSGLTASAAIAEDEALLAEYTVNFKKTHSQTLLPMIDEIVKMIGMDLKELDAVAVSEGPGSFTGLRIGSATAKGIALALEKKIVPVPTLDALAYNLYDTLGLVCPIMDARRGQVYTAIYRFEDHRLVCIREKTAESIEDLAAELNGLPERQVTFLGDGVPVFRERLAEILDKDFSFAPAHLSRQRAGAVAALGIRYYKEGRAQESKDHKPEYLRPSQAERVRAEKLSGGGEKS